MASLPEDMEPIIEDNNHSQWLFCAPERTYYRVYDRTKTFQKIHGDDIPNPELLWKKRIRTFSEKGKVNREELRCSPATEALYNHYLQYRLANPE